MREDRIRHCFVYGTLMASATDPAGVDARRCLTMHAVLLGNITIPGALFDLGACPALLLNHGRSRAPGRVHGELWRIQGDGGFLLDVLDRYEGYDAKAAEPSAYERRKIRVAAPDGRRVMAWVYVWTLSTQDLRPIPDGRWRSRVQFDRDLLPALSELPPTFGAMQPPLTKAA